MHKERLSFVTGYFGLLPGDDTVELSLRQYLMLSYSDCDV